MEIKNLHVLWRKWSFIIILSKEWIALYITQQHLSLFLTFDTKKNETIKCFNCTKANLHYLEEICKNITYKKWCSIYIPSLKHSKSKCFLKCFYIIVDTSFFRDWMATVWSHFTLSIQQNWMNVCVPYNLKVVGDMRHLIFSSQDWRKRIECLSLL